jgi:hypothetical protein
LPGNTAQVGVSLAVYQSIDWLDGSGILDSCGFRMITAAILRGYNPGIGHTLPLMQECDNEE